MLAVKLIQKKTNQKVMKIVTNHPVLFKAGIYQSNYYIDNLHLIAIGLNRQNLQFWISLILNIITFTHKIIGRILLIVFARVHIH